MKLTWNKNVPTSAIIQVRKISKIKDENARVAGAVTYIWIAFEEHAVAVGAGVVWRRVGTLASPLRGLLYPDRILSLRRAIAHTWIVNPWSGRRKRPHSTPLLPIDSNKIG